MALYSDQAVVIRSYKLGEADKIIVFYTLGRGKVRAVAKGVRRTKSKFGSRLEQGSIVDLMAYEGKNLDTITQVERLELFNNIRNNLELYSKATLILETLDAFTEDNSANAAFYNLTIRALAELDKTENPLVASAFLSRIITLEGVQPSFNACVTCGRSDDLVAFSLELSGVTCSTCRNGQRISENVLSSLQKGFSGQVNNMLNSSLAPDDLVDIESILCRIVEGHIERALKSRSAIFI